MNEQITQLSVNRISKSYTENSRKIKNFTIDDLHQAQIIYTKNIKILNFITSTYTKHRNAEDHQTHARSASGGSCKDGF